ncbi:MAG: MetS family NSS transporter small subunit [Firmicutes bacterium]|nr:MetS family NSS transporter small subunit [Bacillota bacterium]
MVFSIIVLWGGLTYCLNIALKKR